MSSGNQARRPRGYGCRTKASLLIAGEAENGSPRTQRFFSNYRVKHPQPKNG
jgi:hypothetical protein